MFLHLSLSKDYIDPYSHCIILVLMLLVIASLNTSSHDRIAAVTLYIDSFIFNGNNLLDEIIIWLQKDYKRSSTRRLINYFLSSIQKRECLQSIK